MVPAGRKIFFLKIIAVAMVFALSFFTGKYAADWGAAIAPQQPNSTEIVNESSNSNYELPVNRLNVLLLGIDARQGEKDARTDSMMLVSIDRETKKIAMVSIPRDSMVEITGHGTDKINKANVFGGPDLARKTVEKLLGVEIPYYVKTNFNGFKEIIDVLGGVDIDVDKRMYYPVEDIDLQPGRQRLDGYDALAYVRYRHDALGDINRAERQQTFLKALVQEMLRPATIIKAPRLIPKLMAAVETNLGVTDAILVARAASSLDSDNIMSATLPGVFYNYKGASYWKIDQDKASAVLKNLFAGVRVATITGPDITIPADVPAEGADQQLGTGEGQNAEGQNTEGQTTEGQGSGQGTGTENPGPQEGKQGSQPGETGQNSDQQGGQYPGQEGQYPGQDQNAQYPGQTQEGGQSNGQNPNEQVIIKGPANNGQDSGSMDTFNNPGTPAAPAGQPVQNPTESTDAGQSVIEPGGTTSSGAVYGG